MEKSKLNPCPFCGGQVETLSSHFGVVGVVNCKNCMTKFVLPWNESESPNNLFEAWNQRTRVPSLLVEKLHPVMSQLGKLIENYQADAERLTERAKEYYGDGETVSRYKWIITQRNSASKTALMLNDIENMIKTAIN